MSSKSLLTFTSTTKFVPSGFVPDVGETVIVVAAANDIYTKYIPTRRAMAIKIDNCLIDSFFGFASVPTTTLFTI